ncbi:Trp biosynthesis-associated membrane protein [Kribbella deserti]|uniref:Trp biosynthesis-associated membrane protein n=1 Tax=Kribbella deserti TaxID=1926257 RepID=A0ABV6QKM1_9ACTN
MKSQRLVDLLVLVGAALLALAAYLTWTTADPGNGREVVTLAGKDVTKAPITIALASVVALVVVRLAGTAMRRILSGLVAVLGAAAILVATQVRPSSAELARLRPALSEVVTDHVTVSTGAAPWPALAGGVALVVAGMLGVLTAHRWRGPTARYERPGDGVAGGTPADQWKAIDAGEDPTA